MKRKQLESKYLIRFFFEKKRIKFVLPQVPPSHKTISLTQSVCICEKALHEVFGTGA